MAKSRTANTVYNFITSVFGQVLTIVLQFVVRTIFIQALGKSYLGINGLFSNILQMLSLAELGVGSAIIFKLYEPLAKKDKKRISILLDFYKKVYKIIGIIVGVVGLSLIPFLKYIVKDYNNLSALGINAILVYIMYLSKSVISYFFLAYKSAIVKADQKEYKLTIINYLVTFISSILQIIGLLLFKSFELYVAISIFSVLLQNFLNARIAKKLYPYIDDKYDEKLSKEEKKNIYKDCGALLIDRINYVVLKATDNIVISMFLGLGMVGMYSNYYIFYTTISSIFTKIFESVKHSLGNLHTTNDINHEYLIFKIVNLISLLLGATAGVGIACVSSEFIKVWIGKEWIIAQPFSILMGIEVLGLSTRNYLGRYRSTMGLFQQVKYRPLFGSIINLIASILLVRIIGISGVLLGTIIADWTTVMWYDPYVIHKFGFKNNFKISKYYLKNTMAVIASVISGALSMYICNHFFINYGWLSVILHSIIVLVLTPLTLLVLYRNTDEYRFLKNKVKSIIKKVVKK